MDFTRSFKDKKDIVDFLFSKTSNEITNNLFYVFARFETVILIVENNLGGKLIVNTQYKDPNSTREYISWEFLADAALNFIKANSDSGSDYSSINLHVRLRAPKEVYDELNYNKLGEYSFFDINFTLNSAIKMVSTSAVEKKLPVVFPEASMDWDKKVNKYIDLWRGKSYISSFE